MRGRGRGQLLALSVRSSAWWHESHEEPLSRGLFLPPLPHRHYHPPTIYEDLSFTVPRNLMTRLASVRQGRQFHPFSYNAEGRNTRTTLLGALPCIQ